MSKDFDYRECAGCGWRTTLSPQKWDSCDRCGGHAMIRKTNPHQNFPTPRRGGRKVKSSAGQLDLFNKDHTGDHDAQG